MLVWLKEPYTGKVTKHKEVSAGVHDMDNTAGAYLVENRPDIAQLVDEDFVPPVAVESTSFFSEEDDEPVFLVNAPVSEQELPSNHPKGNQFLCCNKNWKNQGKVNFHHRKKNCPCHKE